MFLHACIDLGDVCSHILCLLHLIKNICIYLCDYKFDHNIVVICFIFILQYMYTYFCF